MTSALTTGDRLRQLDPVFAQMTIASVGHARSVPELTDREKTFLNVVGDICQGSLGLAFTAHVQGGLRAGVTVEDLRDLLRFVAYDIGYPAAVSPRPPDASISSLNRSITASTSASRSGKCR